MKDLNTVFFKAKEKKCYRNLLEFQNIIEEIVLGDKEITLDWDNGAGEEWARFTKSEVGVICMMNAKIGIAFVRQKYFDKDVLEILKSLVVVDVLDYSSDEWYIDLSVLENKTPEINWNVSPYAIDTNKMSLNDLYFATV